MEGTPGVVPWRSRGAGIVWRLEAGMVPEGLADLVDEFGLVVAFVASTDEGTVEAVGQPAALQPDDLARQLFGSSGAIAALNRSLDGQRLPQIFSQGAVSCVVCKPNKGTLVGLMYYRTRDVVEQHRWSKTLDGRVAALWG
jgi:hypothetical protein